MSCLCITVLSHHHYHHRAMYAVDPKCWNSVGAVVDMDDTVGLRLHLAYTHGHTARGALDSYLNTPLFRYLLEIFNWYG